MDWKIVKGREEQVEEIAALYARTIDALVEGVNYTGWQRGGYPGEETAREGVAAGTLYVQRGFLCPHPGGGPGLPGAGDRLCPAGLRRRGGPPGGDAGAAAGRL